jgi:hypothetical protein
MVTLVFHTLSMHANYEYGAGVVFLFCTGFRKQLTGNCTSSGSSAHVPITAIFLVQLFTRSVMQSFVCLVRSNSALDIYINHKNQGFFFEKKKIKNSCQVRRAHI